MERLTGLFYHTRLSNVNRNPLKIRLFFKPFGIFSGFCPHIFPLAVVYCWKGACIPPPAVIQAGVGRQAATHDHYEKKRGNPL